MVEQTAQVPEQRPRVDQMLEYVGTNDRCVVKQLRLDGQCVGSVEVDFKPAAVWIVLPAENDVLAKVDAKLGKMPGQSHQLLGMAATHVDDPLAFESQCKV